jgi:hypothetical protein
MFINKKFFATFLLSLPLIGAAQQRAATGPVESVQKSQRAITVLGQTFTISSATRFALDGKLVSPSVALDAIAENQDIYVEGQDRGNTTVATLVSLSPSEYVPGSTSVYVLGAVEEISKTSGLIRLQSLQIDSSTVDPNLLGRLRVGSVIEVVGVQPLLRGTLVEANLKSVGGSGRQLQSVGGSGSQLQSVGGSGIQKSSVAGSGTQLQSVGGSGSQLQSVGGSGIQVQSVGGSGAQKSSVGGSGIQVQSVGGSGAQKSSVGGSGIQVQSVGGSGSKVQSVEGSGLQTLSVGGSGIQLQSVGGSGLRKSSVGGSGVETASVGGSGAL